MHLFLVLIFAIVVVEGTLSRNDQKSKGSKTAKEKEGPVSSSIFDRNLVLEDPQVKTIIAEHKTYYEKTKQRNFGGQVLGYVTPWNNHGYDVAKTFSSKFAYISPVWLQIRREGTNKYSVDGTHDVDKSWMKVVRKSSSSGVEVVPRVLFDNWSSDDFIAILSGADEKKHLVNTIIKTAKIQQFDGIVLEVWSQLAGRVNIEPVLELILSIARRMHEAELRILLVIPPTRGDAPGSFTKVYFDRLVNDIDAFSLMTYDFSNPQRPGPNSPLRWASDCVMALVPDNNDPRRAKILLGMNFYGNDYTPNGGGPIVNHEYISLLKNFKGRFQYDNTSAEHMLELRTDTGRHLVFYPTLYSVHKRVRLAEELGTGIAIWELGQGLDYFYDLF